MVNHCFPQIIISTQPPQLQVGAASPEPDPLGDIRGCDLWPVDEALAHPGVTGPQEYDAAADATQGEVMPINTDSIAITIAYTLY